MTPKPGVRETGSSSRLAAVEKRGVGTTGLSEEAILKAEELANWEFVKDSHDIEQLRDHLARFPKGSTERYALSKVEALTWSGVEATRTTKRVREFLSEFPNGKFSGTARALLDVLEREALEAELARDLRLRETEDWSVASRSTSVEDLVSFLKRWPTGKHREAAQQRIRELKESQKSGVTIQSMSVVLVLLAGLSFVLAAALYLYSASGKVRDTSVPGRPALEGVQAGQGVAPPDTSISEPSPRPSLLPPRFERRVSPVETLPDATISEPSAGPPKQEGSRIVKKKWRPTENGKEETPRLLQP